ncbi:MAG TPA: Holliday junction resolvase RuvX [Alphaproteobacteria bacterium]|nr:Holliday junction resolvase RuvX [Alphaproteobacteria bacterium]
MKARLVKDCKDQIPKNCRLMGLDLGSKTIGVAVSDPMQSIATPVTTINRTKFSKDILALGKLIKELEIGGYILGWPLNMDGTEGPRCDVTRSFADEMTKHPEIFGKNPFIALQDERLSTQAVDDFLDNTVNMHRKNRKNVIDKLAAQVILQGALDSFQE